MHIQPISKLYSLEDRINQDTGDHLPLTGCLSNISKFVLDLPNSLFLLPFKDCWLYILLLLGGGSLMSREERSEIRAVADEEFEAEQRVLKKRKKEKRVQNRDQSTEDDLGSLFGDGIKGKLPRFANKITFKVCCLSYLFFTLHNTL